jgi:hypothetical protein
MSWASPVQTKASAATIPQAESEGDVAGQATAAGIASSAAPTSWLPAATASGAVP